MSTALAIAGVTQVLKDLLNDGVINDITTAVGAAVTVTSLPPDRIDSTGEASQLNIYMYQATPNQGWRNEGFPSFNSTGERVSNPPLALDLHYLLSAYTGGQQLHTEILLGYGMQLFHENPVLSRDAINKSLTPPDDVDLASLPPTLQALASTGLATQVELLKISPELLNAEEMSKLWTAFGAKYRPTAAYRVTVVLIQSSKPTKNTLPVKDVNIKVSVFNQPLIEDIGSVPAPPGPVLTNQLIFFNSFLTLTGRRFSADNVLVNVSGQNLNPANVTVADTSIQFVLPAGLKAGVQSVQVVHQIQMYADDVSSLRNGEASPLQSFILSPLVTANGIPTGTTVNGFFGGNIQVKVKPGIVDKQNVRLLLNGLAPTTGSYVFEVQSFSVAGAPVKTINIPVGNVASGKYLMRLQVDGAESQLEADSTGKYNSPIVIIP